MACGGGLAASVTALYFLALYGFPALIRHLPKIGIGPATLRVTYEDGRGVLRQVLETSTNNGFSVAQVTVAEHRPSPGMVDVQLTLYGRPPAALLAATLKEMTGVVTVSADDSNAVDG